MIQEDFFVRGVKVGYDGHQVVFKPERVSVRKLQERAYELHHRFYSLRKAVRFLLREDLYGTYLRYFSRRFVKRWWHENRDYFAYLRSLTAESAAS